jgi:hypothetical protein
VVNLALAGADIRNNATTQNILATALDKSGFTENEIVSLTSKRAFNEEIEILDFYSDNAFDYIGVSESLQPGGDLINAINNAESEDRQALLDFYHSAYQAVYDYTISAIEKNDIVNNVNHTIANNIPPEISGLGSGDPVFDIIYKYKTEENFRNGVDARVLADTSEPPKWDNEQIANYCGVFIAYETTAAAIKAQDNNIIANVIKS